ncbi:DUF5667 domain-containing protein [Chloroflexota bacterium]
MSNITDNMQPIDPKLIEKIELMRSTPERDPQSVTQGRDRFLAELDGIPVNGSRSPLAWFSGLINRNFNQREENSISTKSQKFAFSTLIAIIIVVVMLFGGASATAYASQSALPGDGLYPVKTRLELAQIALESDDYSETQLHLLFAQKRMDEINALLLHGRSEDVEIATSEFEHHIQEAFENLGIVMANDPELGIELTKQISQALLDYAISLKTTLLNSPDPIKPAVESAFLISQDGVGEEYEVIGNVEFIDETSVDIEGETFIFSDLTEFEDVIVLGDMVKLHVILTADGNKIVREIELFSSSDDDGDHDSDDDGDHDSDDDGDHDSDDDGDHDSDDDGDHDGDDDDSVDHDGDDDDDDGSDDEEDESDSDGDEDDD